MGRGATHPKLAINSLLKLCGILAFVRYLLAKLCWPQHQHGNPEVLYSPALIHNAQSYYTLNCDLSVSGSVFKFWIQTKPNSFKLHISIEVNVIENKTFWMSIPDLTQVLLINTLCFISIYFFNGNFPLFYGGSFEGVGTAIEHQANK